MDLRNNIEKVDKDATWIPLKELLKVLYEKEMWSMDTKYLHLYLDTRFTGNDFHCTVKDRNDEHYLTLEDIQNKRYSVNDSVQKG